MKKTLPILLTFALGAICAPAASLFWDPDGAGANCGGAGTWDTTSALWTSNACSTPYQPWANGTTQAATFPGSASAAITLGVGITLNSLTNAMTAGTLSFPAGNQITFGGTAPSLDTTNKISMTPPLKGSVVLTKSGPGQLQLNNNGQAMTQFIVKAGAITTANTNKWGVARAVDGVTLDGGGWGIDTTSQTYYGQGSYWGITIGPGGGSFGSANGTLTMTLAGKITGSGSISFGGGGVSTAGYTSDATWSLGNTGNDYTGSTTVSRGTLRLTASGVVPDTSTVSVSSGKTFDLNNFNETIKSLSGAGNVTLGSGTLTLAAGANTFSGVISETGGLTKLGTGTETLSGNNTYSGLTVVGAGTLTFSGTSTCTGSTVVSNGATLKLNVPDALTASPVILSSGAVLNANAISPNITALSGSGTVTNLAANSLTVNGAANTLTGQLFHRYSCFSGVILEGSLVKDGTHAMALRGSNTFDGTLTLTAGTLSVGAGPDRLPPTIGLTVAGGALFQLDANNQAVSTLSGSGSINLGGGLLTVNQGGFDNFGGTIQNCELAGAPTAAGHGLRGYYYTNIDFVNLAVVRDDSVINFTNLSTFPVLAKTNQISTRWLGQVLTTTNGTYTFGVRCDDGQRLWVNGVLLVDDWRAHGLTTATGTITLDANTRYDVVMEMFNNTSGGGAELLWTPPGDTGLFIIPTDYLFLPGPGQLVKAGSGTQQLSAASTYSGGTLVAAGTLQAGTDGALGSGNVTVEDAAILQLDTSAALASTADLLLNGAAPNANLNFFGTGNIHGLAFNGVHQPAGTYGRVGLGGVDHEDGRFTGDGILNVTAAPSATALATSTSTVVYGSTVTFTATVTGAGPVPTGTVSFFEGGNFIGSAALNGSGIAALAYSGLSASPHSITAVYGGDAGYAPSVSSPITQTINVLTLIPSITISDKVYDGTTAARIDLTATTLGGLLAKDADYVRIAGTYTANFDTKDVGAGKTVSISGLALAGSLSGNYQLSVTSLNTSANITNKVLTVTGITANNKVYDATTAATLTGTPALQAAEAPAVDTGADGKPYTGDEVNLGGTPVANFTNKAAQASQVVVTGLSLGGAQAFNYVLQNPTLAATITKLPTAVTGVTANSKPYDGGTNATLSGTATNTPPLFAGDAVSLGGTPVASFTNANVGLRGVVVTGYALSGADAVNYTLSQPSGLSANINQVGTSTVVSSSANPAGLNDVVIFTATVTTAVPNTNSPIGSVQFRSNNVVVSGAIPLIAVSPSVSQATFNLSFAMAGTWPIEADYSGDANYQFSVGTVNQTISSAACSSTNTILSIVNNGNNTVTLTMLGTPNAQYYLVSHTDVAAPFNQWTPVAGSTNMANSGNGQWTFTTASGSGNRNYRSVAVQTCP